MESEGKPGPVRRLEGCGVREGKMYAEQRLTIEGPQTQSFLCSDISIVTAVASSRGHPDGTCGAGKVEVEKGRDVLGHSCLGDE